MPARIDYYKTSPDAFKAILDLENFIANDSGLEEGVIGLVKLRASQINGCAYCVDMHTKEARKFGFNEQKISLVAVWREAAVFDAKERAVLEWTESLTNISATLAPDAHFEPLAEYFSNDEIVKLTLAIGTINVWNRLAVGLRTQHPIDSAA